MKELHQLRCNLAKQVLEADYPILEKFENLLKKEELIVKSDKEKQKRERQQYNYSYRQIQDTITETTIGKNVGHSHISQEEFLTIIELVFLDLINSKGEFQAVESYYEKTKRSIPRIRTVFRICERLGLMKKTYMSGRIYSAEGGKSGFLIRARQRWKDQASTL